VFCRGWTLRLGLRYEVEGTFRTPRQDAAGFDLTTGEQLLSEHIAEVDFFENFCSTVRPDMKWGISRYLDPAAVDLPLVSAPNISNSGRNILHDRVINNWDSGVYKVFRLTEGSSVEFRHEAFNAFDHTQFGTPGTNRETVSFGVISGRTLRGISQVVMKIMW
jgi:hypothetical protein